MALSERDLVLYGIEKSRARMATTESEMIETVVATRKIIADTRQYLIQANRLLAGK